YAVADVHALGAAFDAPFHRRRHEPDPGALWPRAGDDAGEHLADSRRQPERRGGLGGDALDLVRGVLLRGAVLGDLFQFRKGVARRLTFDRRLEQPLRHEIGKAPVRRRRMRVTAGRERKMRAWLLRTLGHVFAPAEQL